MGHVHNSLDRATDLTRGIRRAVGMVGPDGGVERLGETLTPIMDVWSRPEWNALRGDWLQWCFAAVGAGGAGTRSIARLRPVSTSKMLVVVHLIECNTAFLIQNALAADLPTNIGVGQRDTRNPTDGRVRFTIDNTAAAAGTNRFRVDNVPFRYEGPPIICHTDGDGTNSGAVTVSSPTDNQAINVSIAYTIHDLVAGENRSA